MQLNELKESNKLQTFSRSVSQPISSGSEITRRVHEKIPAPVAKVESQSSEGTGGTLPSQTIKPSDILKGLEKLGKNKGTGNVATEMSVDGAYYSVMDAFGDSSLNDSQALAKALETYKKLSGWDKFGNGWTKRLDNVIHLYRHNDYNKTY